MDTYSGGDDAYFQKKISLIPSIFGSEVSYIKRIGGGRNGRLYLVMCENSDKYVVKFYFFHELDTRDRMDVEFSAMQFLWENGVRSIPRPISIQSNNRFAIYEYIDGAKILPEAVTNEDIDYATDFLKRINEVSAEAANLPSASEACFSVKEIVENLEKRHIRLAEMSKETNLNEFLEREFLPLFNAVVMQCRLKMADTKLEYSSMLEGGDRLLSPSDFGFHNALRRKDGSLVFLDCVFWQFD